MKKLYIFFILISVINIKTYACYKNTSITGARKKIEEKYKKIFKEYNFLQEKLENQIKKNSKCTAIIAEIGANIEKKESELKTVEEEISKFVTFLEETTNQEIPTVEKYEACLEMARLFLRPCEDLSCKSLSFKDATYKNYEDTRFYLEKVLKYDMNNKETRKNLCLDFIAEAHGKYIELYKRLIDDNKNPEIKKSYYKKVAVHNQRSKLLFQEILNKKALDIDGKLKVLPSRIHIYEQNMLEAALESAIYALKYIKNNKDLNTEQTERYKKIAKKYFEEIIEFVNKKEQPTTIMLYCKILALVKLAIYCSRYERPLNEIRIEEIKTLNDASLENGTVIVDEKMALSKTSEPIANQEKTKLINKILGLFEQAEDLTKENEKRLKFDYYNAAINKILELTKHNISVLKSGDFDPKNLITKSYN